MFLTALQKKTFRGMEDAVLKGRFASGRAYGYRKVVKIDANGKLARGILDIDPAQDAVVRSIYADAAV